jgi:DNA-directed RNA polymerase
MNENIKKNEKLKYLGVLKQKLEQQKELEQQSIEDATKKMNELFIKNTVNGSFADTSPGMSLIRMSIDRVEIKLEKVLSNSNNRGVARKVLLEYFDKKEYKTLSYIAIKSVLNAIGARNDTFTEISNEIFKNIEKHILVSELEKDNPYLVQGILNAKHRKGWAKQKQLKTLSSAAHELNIDTKVKVQIGLTLLKIVLEANVGLFIETIRFNGTKKSGSKSVGLSKDLLPMLDIIRKKDILNIIQYKPMIVEPRDWTHFYDNAGYLTDNTLSFIKLNHKISKQGREYFEEYDELGGFDKMYDEVNKIQKTKWQVNKKVLKIVEYIIDNNLIDPSTTLLNQSLYGGIPYANELDTLEIAPEDWDKSIPGSKYKWFKNYLEAQDYQQVNRSKRLAYYSAVHVAKEYSNFDEFYFTYNTDFRGRLYPVQQTFNPQGTGKVKALLQFKEGQILDEKGLYWLKVHISNCYGNDKDSYEDRVKWFDDNKVLVEMIGRNPLDNLKHLGSEDPLMFLAGCLSYIDYLDGKKVHLPLAMDAVCSGIQVYSGLLLDKEGAAATCVIGEERNDIYEAVAKEARRILNDKEHSKIFQRKLKGEEEKIEEYNSYKASEYYKTRISRKLVKRNVMTTPYSVSAQGITNQIRDVMLEDKANGGSLLLEGEEYTTYRLLTEVHMKAINNVVKAAGRGQKFIVECVSEFYKDVKNGEKAKTPIIWTNFMDFPVFQQYQREESVNIKTLGIQVKLKKRTENIDRGKQKNGIAPNFVHSVDAAILFNTVKKCAEKGVENFMLIHDSFSVLPNDIEVLHQSFRESYVEIMGTKPLEKFEKEVLNEEKFIPYVADLDLQEVLNSKYIIS